MIKKVFTVYDAKAQAFLTPFFETASGIANRIFMEACQNPEHHFWKYAEDFTLFELGEFDDNTGQFTNLPAPEMIEIAMHHKNTPAFKVLVAQFTMIDPLRDTIDLLFLILK